MRGQKDKLSNKSPVDGFPSNYCGRKTVMSLTAVRVVSTTAKIVYIFFVGGVHPTNSKTSTYSYGTFSRCALTTRWIIHIYSISQKICTRFCCALLCCGYGIVQNEFT